MTSEPVVRLTDTPDAAARQAIVAGLVGFNRSRTGVDEAYHRLAVLLEQPETGLVVGGLWGATYYRHLFIELLLVPELLRGTGLGRRLMTDAETEAHRRGCIGVWLDTYSFQARSFYERLGYRVFGALDDFPPGHSRFFLHKALAVSPAA
jgi:GNAT superfamily N-acetyltransferase